MTGLLSGTYAVTGGASGIGEAVALSLGAAGADVSVLDIDVTSARRVANQIGGQALGIDISSPESVQAAFGQIEDLRGLVACAGVSLLQPIVSMSLAEWRRVLAVNLDGTFLCVQAAARSLLRSQSPGTIVAVSSVNSRYGHRGNGAYGASKAGIEMLVRNAALELAQAGIRVNAVAPGIVLSGMTADVASDQEFVNRWTEAIPLGRLGLPEDVADVAVFLSGTRSRWITGQTIVVDGGSSLRVEPKVHPDTAWDAQSLVATFT